MRLLKIPPDRNFYSEVFWAPAPDGLPDQNLRMTDVQDQSLGGHTLSRPHQGTFTRSITMPLIELVFWKRYDRISFLGQNFSLGGGLYFFWKKLGGWVVHRYERFMNNRELKNWVNLEEWNLSWNLRPILKTKRSIFLSIYTFNFIRITQFRRAWIILLI